MTPPRVDLSLPTLVDSDPGPHRMPFSVLVLGDHAGREIRSAIDDRRVTRLAPDGLTKERERLGVVSSPLVERRWRDLGALAAAAAATSNVEVHLLAATAAELRLDHEDHGLLTGTALYGHLVRAEYGGRWGAPHGIVVFDEYLAPDRATATLLQHLAKICAVAHATLLVPPSPALAAPVLADVLTGPLAPHLWVGEPLAALPPLMATYALHDVPSLTDMRLFDALIGRCIKRQNLDRRQPAAPQVQAWLAARTGPEESDAFTEASVVLVPEDEAPRERETGDVLDVSYVPGRPFPAERRRVRVSRDRE